MNEYRDRYPVKSLAHGAVATAVKRGKIHKPTHCEACGTETRLHGHHEDYEQRLAVLWVCPACHKRLHHPNAQPRQPYQRKTPWRDRKQYQPAPKRDALLEQATTLRQAGTSYRQIAKQLGVTVGTVYKWLNATPYK